MGLEIEHPQQFLEEAKQAVAAYQVVSEQLKTQREEERQASTALEKLRKDTQEKIQKTIKARGEEITATYDKQLSQVDARLKKAQDERERARKEGVKGRIRKETEPLVTENRELLRQLAAILKKDHAPAFCKTGVFYTLFRPSGFGEIFACLLTFALLFAALPFGIYYLISQHQIWQLVLMFGLHYAVLPIIMNNFSTIGYDTTLSSTFGCNFAQIGATLAIRLKTKDHELKKRCFPSLFPAAVGIIEPALYGVTLRNRKTFIITCIVSGITGVGMTIFGARAYRFAGFGIFGYAAYVNPKASGSTGILIAVVWSFIAFVLSFVMTYATYTEEPQN